MTSHLPLLLIDSNDRDYFWLGLFTKKGKQTAKQYQARAQELPAAIESFLKTEKLTTDQLASLGFVRRAGSLTGSRIGAVTVNTLAWLKDIPVLDIEADSFDLAIKKVINGSYFSVAQLTNID